MNREELLLEMINDIMELKVKTALMETHTHKYKWKYNYSEDTSEPVILGGKESK